MSHSVNAQIEELLAQESKVEYVVRVATRKQYYCENGFTARIDLAERYPQQRDAENMCMTLNGLFRMEWMVVRVEPQVVYVERPSVRQMTVQRLNK